VAVVAAQMAAILAAQAVELAAAVKAEKGEQTR
jgi:hypothetical protein